MKIKHLALFLLALPSFAGEIILNCDSRVINEKTCVGLLQDSLKTLGCSSSSEHCVLRPWGSDFIKSWTCSSQSSDCSPTLQTACPLGSTRTFNEVMDVCEKSKSAPASVHGTCNHEQAAHTILVKNCSEGPATCAKFGGTPVKCDQPEGYSNQWNLSCGFPNLQVTESASDCSELRSKCELINTEKGSKGFLLSCLLNKQ